MRLKRRRWAATNDRTMEAGRIVGVDLSPNMLAGARVAAIGAKWAPCACSTGRHPRLGSRQPGYHL